MRVTIKPENQAYIKSLSEAWDITKQSDVLNYLLHELKRQGYGLTPLQAQNSQVEFVSIPKSEMYQEPIAEYQEPIATEEIDPVIAHILSTGLICEF